MQDRVANASRENDFHLTGIRVCTKLPKKGLLNKLYAYVKYIFYEVFFVLTHCPYHSDLRDAQLQIHRICRRTQWNVILFMTTLLSSIKHYEVNHRYFMNFNLDCLVFNSYKTFSYICPVLILPLCGITLSRHTMSWKVFVHSNYPKLYSEKVLYNVYCNQIL